MAWDAAAAKEWLEGEHSEGERGFNCPAKVQTVLLAGFANGDWEEDDVPPEDGKVSAADLAV